MGDMSKLGEKARVIVPLRNTVAVNDEVEAWMAGRRPRRI